MDEVTHGAADASRGRARGCPDPRPDPAAGDADAHRSPAVRRLRASRPAGHERAGAEWLEETARHRAMLGEPCARCGALAVELVRYRIRDPLGDHVAFRAEYACGECGHRPPPRAQSEE